MNHVEATLYAMFFTFMAAFVIPLPGDESLLQTHLKYSSVKEEITEVINFDKEEILNRIKLAEKAKFKTTPPVEVVKVVKGKKKKKEPSPYMDDRQLYVDAIKSVYKVEFPYELADYVVRIARQEGVNRDLLFALMAAESSFDPTALSHVGAIGYTQVWPKWHKERIGGRDITDPKVNIQVGANYLRECLDTRGDLYEGLACYNGAKTKGEKDRYFNKVIHRSNLLVSSMDL